MALEYNNKTYRNLQEQVYKNMQDISNIVSEELTLANFGIYVKGIVPEDFEIPYIEDPNSYIEDGGSSGDAYLVGTVEPYNLYIYTRVSDISYEWLNIGEFPKAGPQGLKGDTGAQGEMGNQRPWCISTTQLPTINILADPSALVEGDICLVVGSFDENEINYDIGDILVYDGGQWAKLENIKGARGPIGVQGPIGPQGIQGVQGIQGPRGDTGTIMKIMGKWDYQISDLVNHPLPDPAVILDPTYAYLVPENLSSNPVIYDLFIQIGSTPETRLWTNNGPITGGTDVYVGSDFQQTYDMNKKLDKVTTGSTNQVYTKTLIGAQAMVDYNTSATGNSIVQRTNTGQIECTSPLTNDQAVQRGYLQSLTVSLLPNTMNGVSIGTASLPFNNMYCNNSYVNNIGATSSSYIQTRNSIYPLTNNTLTMGNASKIFNKIYSENIQSDHIGSVDSTSCINIENEIFLTQNLTVKDPSLVDIASANTPVGSIYAEHVYANGTELVPSTGGGSWDVLYSGLRVISKGSNATGMDINLTKPWADYKMLVFTYAAGTNRRTGVTTVKAIQSGKGGWTVGTDNTDSVFISGVSDKVIHMFAGQNGGTESDSLYIIEGLKF